MDSNTLMEVYLKERNYQKQIFGNVKDSEVLNVSSFLNFLDVYLKKAKNKYSEGWVDEKPNWMISCKEFDHQNSAPVEMYEHLIKIMTLAGAALEAYTEIEPILWRSEGIKDKWK